MKLLPFRPTRDMVRSAMTAARERYPESSRIPMTKNSSRICGRKTNTEPVPFHPPFTMLRPAGGRTQGIRRSQCRLGDLLRGLAGNAAAVGRSTDATYTRESESPESLPYAPVDGEKNPSSTAEIPSFHDPVRE